MARGFEPHPQIGRIDIKPVRPGRNAHLEEHAAKFSANASRFSVIHSTTSRLTARGRFPAMTSPVRISNNASLPLIFRVDVRWIVVREIDADDDPKEDSD